MLRQIGPTEIVLILAVLLLLVGGKKLPEVARGSGRALRIFRSEIRELEVPEQDLTNKEIATDTETRPQGTVTVD